jgi:hypothetical protein
VAGRQSGRVRYDRAWELANCIGWSVQAAEQAKHCIQKSLVPVIKRSRNFLNVTFETVRIHTPKDVDLATCRS